MVNKRVWNAVLGCNLKNDGMISIHFQGKPFNIMVIQAYAPQVTLKKLKLNHSMKTYKTLQKWHPKRCPFDYRELERNSRKSRDNQSNRQIWPWSTKWSRAKANGVLTREHTGQSKHPLPTTQEKTLHMDINRESMPKSDDNIICSWRWKISIESAKTRPGAYCGSDHELFMAKFRLKLKKVWKSAGPFKY